jgi:hypothetical protein
VVTVGEAETVAPVVALRPVAGDQAYEEAPLAVRLVLPPLHIEGEVGEIVTEGFVPIVTVTVLVAVQPAELVPVIV